MAGEERSAPQYRYTLPGSSAVDRQAVEVRRPDDQGEVGEVAVAPATAIELPPPGRYVVVAPGQPIRVAGRYQRTGRRIILSHTALVVVNGLRSYRLALPSATPTPRRGDPVVDHLVSVYVHRRAIGRINTGHKFVYALDAEHRLLATLDASDTWEVRTGHVAAVATAAGIRHTIEVFETVPDLVATHPDWAAPQLEFEVNHPAQEAGREWAQGVYLGSGLAAACGGTGVFLLSPLAPGYRAAMMGTGAVWFAPTLWATSRGRAQGSLRARPLPGRRPRGTAA